MVSTKTINGRYVFTVSEEALLGQGSMGQVYKGLDSQSGETVAVKALRRDRLAGRPELLARFAREGEALRQLNHPNIVKILAMAEEEGQHYLVMEYVAGGSLQDLIDRQGPLPFGQVFQLSLELADALTRAHHLNIIHRDLKPANILLAADGTPRLTDFGVAFMVDQPRLTDSYAIVGTLRYLSPEACNGESLDARTDIWALGVCLFEMLTGVSPFDGSSYTQTLRNIIFEPPPDLKKLRSDVPEGLADLVQRMLVKDRQQRIASVRQIGAELEHIQKTLSSSGSMADTVSFRRPETIASHRAEQLDATISASRRNQLLLLEKVRQFWINGVLERTTLLPDRIDLPRQTYDTAIDHPWGDTLGRTFYGNQALTVGRSMAEVFSAADRALLILGAPGAGKTTALIELARELIEVAEHDPRQPIPVILNLSSWAQKQGDIADWLVEELTAKYQIPREIGRVWLENNNLILLLDGLDEMDSHNQPACIAALNSFRTVFGLTGLVICSRLEVYEAHDVKLKLGSAVLLRPPSSSQVDAYLAQGGSALDGLRRAIQRDNELRELAQSPLMLTIMGYTYGEDDHGPAITLPKTENEATDRTKTLFTTYVQRMFQRRVAHDNFSPEEVRGWLSFLARRLDEHQQTVFLIEQLQPSWLPSPAWRQFYLLVTRLTAGAALAVFMWLFRLELDPVVLPLNLGLGLLLAGIHMAWFERRLVGKSSRRPRWVSTLTIGLVSGLIATASFALFGAGSANGVTGSSEQIGRLVNALYWGIINGSAITIAQHFFFGDGYRSDIQTVEALNWSTSSALRGIAIGFPLGLLIALLGRYGTNLNSREQFAVVLEATWLLGLIAGLRYNRIETKSQPNQGIRLSLRNAVLAAVLFGLIDGLLVALTSPYGLELGVRRVAQYLVGAGLIYGGFNVIKHYLLRLLLWASDQLPWRITDFLDHAAGLVFLHKVGGGYIFIHRLLQAHFGGNYQPGNEPAAQS